MKKLCAYFLAVAMLITLCVPMAFADAPAFPEDTVITARANGRTVLVTYPNTATLPDGSVAPAYKIEFTATDAEDVVISSSVFATEAHLVENVEVSLPRAITLDALSGNYDVHVYPLSSADTETATVGEPVSVPVSIRENSLRADAVRYEFEDYAPENFKFLAESVVSASGGKLYTSHNGASPWFKKANYTAKNMDPSLSFEIEIPADGMYTVEYLMGRNLNNNNLSVLELAIDDVVIGDNTTSFVQNYSMNSQYPWQYLLMFLFQKRGIALTKGTHTVTLTTIAPTNESQNAQIFAADFLQFIPETYTLTDTDVTVIEMENFAGKLMTDDGTGENSTNSSKIFSVNTSGGAAFHTDSYDSSDINKDAYLTIPVTVKASGNYQLEFVSSKANSSTNLYVDKTDLAALYDNTAVPDVSFQCHTGKDMASLGLDGKEVYSKENSSFYKYFWCAHHAAEKHTANLYLEEGEHTLLLEIKNRGGATPTVAICMDYLSFIPAMARSNISGTGKTTLEMENYTQNITTEGEEYTGATITADAAAQLYASGGKYLNLSERSTLKDACITLPVFVEKSGEYSLNWFVTNAGNGGYLSRATLKIDGEPVLINDTISLSENLSHPDEDGNTTYASLYYPMGRYESRVSLTEGAHVITIDIDPITNFVNNAYGVKCNIDAITFAPIIKNFITVSGETTVEFENYTDAVTSLGSPYSGCNVTEDSRASGGKYMGVSYGYAEEAVIEMPAEVTRAGWYDVNVFMTKKTSTYLSTSTLYLDDAVVLTNQTDYVAEDLSENSTYINHNFPMHRYKNAVYLTEGSHIFKLHVAKTEGDQKVKFYADCFKLTPSEDSVALANGIASSVTVYYDEPVNGTAVIALYKEGKLLNTASVPMDSAMKIDAVVRSEINPDTVKVMVLDSFASIKPVCEAKVFTEFETKLPRLFLMGDSVCAEYGATNYWQQGWGHCIPAHFHSNITVLNNAVGGRSTKTYKTNGHWDSVYNALEVGDFVMINFGLNDFYDISETGKGTTIEQYKENLTEYCTLIKEKGATPILISTIPECNTSYTSLVTRANAMKEVANLCGVVYLPLNETLNMEWIFDENGNYDTDKTMETFNYYYMSEQAFNRIEDTYNCTVPQSQWEYIAETPDRTHINIDGAKHVAKTIVDLLLESDSGLNKFVK